MGARGAAVGILAGDDLALLGDAHAAIHCAGRLGGDGPARRCAAAADGTAAAVEEADLDVVRLAGLDDCRLSLGEFPFGGEVAAVLVAVGVAEHGLDLAVAHECGSCLGLSQQLVEDAGCVVEVADGFEQRHHAGEAGRDALAAADETGQPAHGEDVLDGAGHRQDERADGFRVRAVVAQQTEQRHGFGALR